MDSAPAERWPQAYDRIERAGDVLRLHREGEETRYTFDRLAALPERCSAGRTDDPVANFEAFFRLFQEAYASFDLRGVDWNARYRALRPRVSAGTSASELFALLTEMVAPLNDGHVGLSGGGRTYLGGGPREVGAIAAREGLLATGGSSSDYFRGFIARFVETRVAPSVGIAPLKHDADRIVYWGKVAPRIGYVNFLQMAPPDHAREAVSGSQVVAATRLRMDEILADLGDTDALVFDLRFNTGGWENMALTVAGYFTDVPRLAFSIEPMLEDGSFAPRQDVMIRPQTGAPYLKPVYLLTSGTTISSGESLVMAMKANPQVLQIGERTAGVLAWNGGRLPNGWDVGLTSERYFAADGHSYEGSGIPPDVFIPLDVPGGLLTGTRLGVDAAISIQKSQSNQQ
ncbi:hypothetical protein B2G71_14280 [Novosphingobium sp. PC22D]|uniref:S41 family peptidase n=1 Tax=Novosphingobium sp. PC22D TaxID=1962403 RepID=UPI000BFAD517|nr:S41 family peptidase [Novosphingobium sp. PC22D]PEQ11946.1 hypothetical protein B2G71_14280 [Novosphingobium sp. PC22D]